MKICHPLLLSILICFFLQSCGNLLCGLYGSSTELIQDRSFEDRQLKVNRELTVDLDDYWHFETGCDRERVDAGFETVTIRDTAVAHFLCPDADTALCSAGRWDDPLYDNAFTLKAAKPGTTDVDIRLEWEGETSLVENFSFGLVVLE